MPPNPGQQKQGCCNGACTCCPYGCSYTVPIFSTFIAFVLTTSVAWSCQFFEVSYRNDQDGIFFGEQESKFTIGPWTVEDFNVTVGVITDEDNDCVGWSDHDTLDHDDLDAALRFARFVLFITAVPAYILTFIFFFASCCVFESACLNCIGFSFITMGVLIPFSLVSMASDWCQDANDCRMNWAGVCAILVFPIWILAGVSIIMWMREKDDPSQTRAEPAAAGVEMTNQPLEQTVEQTIVEEDGTVVKLTTTTKTNADGTKTVTETREILKTGTNVAVAASVEPAESITEDAYPVADAKPVAY